jgi:hypothetical protein
MKKTLIITATDGRTFTEDWANMTGIPIGSPANYAGYVSVCHNIASTGYMIKTNEKEIEILAPSQIKTVGFKIEK